MGRDNSRIARRTRGFIWILLVGILSLAAGLRLDSRTLVIRVKVTAANVRNAPQFTGAVLTTVPLDMQLEVIKKSGDWYQVSVLVGNKTADGFIHKSVVEEVALPPQAQKAEPVPPAPAKTPPQTRVAARTERDQAPTAAPADKDQAQMAGLETKIKKESAALLTLARTMKPQATESQGTQQVKMAKIIASRCQVLETNLPGARVIHAPMMGEEFAVLGQSDSFVKVRLRDGREGWITETCLQLFSKTETFKKVIYTGIASADKGNFIKVAEGFFSKLVQLKLFADEIAGSYAKRQDVLPQEKARMAAASDRILGYFDPAAKFYNQYIAGQNLSAAEGRSLVEALSGWANLLVGTANYGNSTLLGGSDTKSGLTLDASAAGTLTLSDTGRVEANASFLSDTIRTPYSTTTVGAGYAYDDRRRLALRAGLSYNGFADGENDTNSYGRLSLGGGGRYALSDTAGLDFDYAFLHHGYSDASMAEADYSSHLLRVAGQFLQGASRFSFQVRTNIETSQTAFHKFFNLEPSLAYEKRGPTSLFRLAGTYESFSFGDLPALSYGRASAQLTLEGFRDSLTRSFDAGFTLKSFPDAKTANYSQIKLRYASSRSAPATRLFSVTALTDLFSQSPENSYTDLRLDHSAEGTFLFSGLSLFSRIWHSPGWGTPSSKPFLIDLTGRLGLNLKYLRIGPTVGVHAAVSSEKGVELIKRQGNLFRFGALAEGTLPLPNGGRLSFSAMYEYGFIYDYSSGSSAGGLVARHPTSLLVTGDLALPLGKSLELVGRLDMYRIATDLDKTFGYNPATGSTKFKLLAGIRYRHN